MAKEFLSRICRDVQIIMFGRSYDLAISGEKNKFDEAGGKALRAKRVRKVARLGQKQFLHCHGAEENDSR